MALNGTIKTNSYSGRYYELSWSATQSIPANQSTINWTLSAKGMSGGWIAERTVYVDIDGVRQYSKTSRVERYDGTVATGSKTLAHDNSGFKSFSISIGAAVYGSNVNVTGSSAFTLNQIPRAATITSAQDFTDEANPIIKYTNPLGNSVTTLQACISFTGAKDDIAYRDISKTGSQYQFILTDTEREALWTRVTSGYSNTVTFYVKTVVGGSTYYSTLTKTLHLVNHTPVASGTITTDGQTQELTGSTTTIIKHITDVEYAAEAYARKGATLVDKYCYNNGNRYYDTGIIENVTNKSFSFFATDSRGNTNDYANFIELDMVEYIPLTAELEGSIEIDEGENAKASLTITGSFWSGNFGALENYLVMSAKYFSGTLAEDGTDEWQQLPIEKITYNTTKHTYRATATIENLPYKDKCTIQIVANDAVSLVNSNSIELITIPVFDWGQEDFAFNVPVTIQGNAVTDYIVERSTRSMGSNGTWQIEKWASGKAVCYGVRNYGNMAINEAWGSVYMSQAFTQSLPNIFIEAPSYIDIGIYKSGSGGWVLNSNASAATATATGAFRILSAVSQTASQTYMQFYVIGKWR